MIESAISDLGVQDDGRLSSEALGISKGAYV